MSSTHHAKRLYIGTTAERTALSLTTDGRGIVWYDTDQDRAYIWSGSAWVEVTKISEIYESDGGGPAWSVDATGNLSAAGVYNLTTTGDVTVNDVSASGSITITGAGQAFQGDSNSEPDLGTTAAGGKIGSIYMAGGEKINAPTSLSLTAGAIGSDIAMITLTNTVQDVLDLGDVAGTGDVDIDFNNDQMFLEGSSGNFRVSAYAMADTNGFIVKNTSGAAATAGDAGYLDENNEYKTTTTVEDQKANPVAVLVGGANNADIYVTQGGGRATLNYTGSAPSTGDTLTFSGTAGFVQARSTMHPGVLAQARAAGSGGTVEVELLLRRADVNLSPADFMFRVDLASDSDFVALIDSLPGGAAVRYDTPTSGNENCIVPNSTNNFAKIVLHNTTRGDYALVDTVNTTGGAGYDGEITLTAAVPGTWMATDTITARSQTNTNTQGTSYWFDCELLDTTEVPALATKLYCQVRWLDSGGVGESQAQHPFKAFNSPDAIFTNGQVANQALYQYVEIPLIQRRFQVLWTASGAATARPRLRLLKAEVAT